MWKLPEEDTGTMLTKVPSINVKMKDISQALGLASVGGDFALSVS